MPERSGGESETHNPWKFLARTARGCVFLTPIYVVGDGRVRTQV